MTFGMPGFSWKVRRPGNTAPPSHRPSPLQGPGGLRGTSQTHHGMAFTFTSPRCEPQVPSLGPHCSLQSPTSWARVGEGSVRLTENGARCCQFPPENSYMVGTTPDSIWINQNSFLRGVYFFYSLGLNSKITCCVDFPTGNWWEVQAWPLGLIRVAPLFWTMQACLNFTLTDAAQNPSYSKRLLDGLARSPLWNISPCSGGVCVCVWNELLILNPTERLWR